MAVVKTTFDFLCGSYGWSETWYKDSGYPSLKQHTEVSAVPLAQKRAAMLAAESSLVAIQSSFIDVKQDSYLIYTNLPGDQSVHCDTPHTSIYSIVRAINDTKRKSVFVRGQDDNAVMNGGVFQPGAAQFVAAGTIFFNAITQGAWGWMRSVGGTPGKVIDYVTDQDGFVEFTTNNAMFPAPPANEVTYAHVRILFKGRKTILNGLHTVEVLATNGFRSLKPMAVFPYNGKEGKIIAYTYTFTPAENWNFQKSGERRAGRPKLVTPGRSGARPLG